ncbi:oligosaccharide flippase family protein [Clostridium sp. AL.422]|uniref:oligosaccharide flippase family protein n=1 Tax=Clostridium TaxID=1485 RepID=UPI00293DD705|nr:MULTISPECIES: oligosaccharide flippase family protein [unclassified Clostridium]MDV4150289.1 oligosaccharide flippase family protein [Clostridium sp. AL.422]
MKKTNKNFIYNVVYQVFIFIIPLVSTPYISRILGVNNIGIYSYTYSLVYYFMLASMLGINNYGAREIAKCSLNRSKLSQKFYSIYFLQLICNILMIIFFAIFIVIIDYNHKDILMIQFIFLISCAFDINWFFFGMEEFKITITRNVIIKILSLVLIFALVKNNNDLWLYTLIMSISTFISQVYLWIFIRKRVSFGKISFKEVFSHLPQCLILFIPVIAYSIYRVMDKTMIGFLANTTELGYYESAEKIINIPISFVTALGTVMMPHIAKSSDEELANKFSSTFYLCYFFIIPMVLGLLVISKDFTRFFFGEEFSKTANIIILLLPTILFAAMTNIIRSNYLIPKSKDKIYIMSTALGAIINLIFNIIFIKKYGAYGACIGTVAAEFSVLVYQIVYTKTKINYLNNFKKLLPIVVKSFIMLIYLIIIGSLIENIYTKIIVQVFGAIVIYFTCNYRYILNDFLGIGGHISK